MRLVDHSPFQREDGKITALARLQGSLKYGAVWVRDMQAQSDVVARFNHVLDNRYVMLRNAVLPGTGVPIPLILVGPQGLFVIYVSSLRGFYRAKNEDWLALAGNRFKAIKPNLISRARLMARAVDAFLSDKHIKAPPAEPILAFPNPAVNIDMQSPAVRIVTVDTVDRFLVALARAPAVLDGVTAKEIVEQITETQVEEEPAQEVYRKEDPFALREEEEGGRGVPIPKILMEPPTPKFQLSTKQWVALGVLIFLEMLLLSAFLVLIVFFM